MILKRLTLRNFRTYESLDLTFDEKINLIVGDNAVGKTNLVEAINYLSLARSWRSNEDGPLIKEGADSAYVKAELEEGDLRRTVEAEIMPNGKRISLNGKPLRRLSDMSKLVNVLLFSPADVPLFLDGPGQRRDFLDISLSKQSQDYFSLLSRYNRLLKERNTALKAPAPDIALIEVLGSQMIDVSQPILRYRSMCVSSLNKLLPGLLEELAGSKTSCRLLYKPFAKPDGNFTERAEKLYREALEGDLKRGFTSYGPHREDLRMELNGKDIAEYGSQGENRAAVLALKLSPFFLVEGSERKPICVLDDVTSELDGGRVKRLFGLLSRMGQVFVTTTNLEVSGASYIDVTKNNAVRRNENGR